ncbi:MAG TPA: CHASE3 domain-containing protein [Myxococcaceae bacterium]|nr:CHASE3 domain-containing protein [Myxococcaceae bacterium]
MQQAQVAFERTLRLTVVLPLVLAVPIGAGLLVQIQYLINASQWVEHANQVIGKANRIERLLVDMETGLRGFLLTERPEFLEPYHAASQTIDREFDELKELVVEPEQDLRVDLVQEGERQWLAYARDLLAAPADSASPRSYEVQLRGKMLMDRLRREMAGFSDAEVRLRDERSDRARKAVRQTMTGSGALMLFIGGGMAVFARRQLLKVSRTFGAALQRREHAEEELRQLNQQLEERIRERTRELTETNAELEAFSYSVSHDLRAPLRAIDGFGQVLQEDHAAQLNEDGLDALRRIRAASKRMAQLIDDLLKLSRSTRGELKRTSVDLTNLVLGIVTELRAREPDRKVEVRVAPGITANADPHFLRIALVNLLDNAWKFTRGAPEARIEFGAETVDGERAFLVRDNGAGFDMAYVDKLFAPFQRLHRNADFEGTGIGLATVQRIIHRHDGRIWAEAAVGQGATFRFTLGGK